MEARLKKSLGTGQDAFRLTVDFAFETGEILGLYGPSGSGKTTTLRLLAGLLHPDRGLIRVGATTWVDTDRGHTTPPARRGVGFVFQDYALFPNMTARENLLFAGGQDALTEELLDVFELTELAGRRPAELSGGQRQRVALARAIAQRPKLLLLDEPLAALDDRLRGELRDYLAEIRRRYGIPTVLCSHHAGDLLHLADRLLVLDDGRQRFFGRPSDHFPDAATHEAVVDRIFTEDGALRATLLFNGDRLTFRLTDEFRGLTAGDRVRFHLTDTGLRLC